MFFPHIVQPNRITSHSKTLIDNIFSNYISQDIVSGNSTATISDHLPQFVIAPHIFSNVPNIIYLKPIYLNVVGQNSLMKNSF